ncbi:RNA 2',3'-cyclic phosphodiesterase [Sphingobium bisphenolivorans]|uniref:RNA 2',3'-cyclic phosphodiesterase n=1 Tax=Sphingobium bisphenolivorans TaxID=1335760 RepID=UPI000487FFC5|nr:RNA 2',3'-cyclic phosphodiesterase [Sphingobium bisphenolivorans]
MHRLFVAVRPPPDIRARLLAIMSGVNGARWQDDDQLHITLRFIGEVDRHRANELADALRDIRFPPAELALSGVGSFNRKGQVHTLWAGIQPREPLVKLHQKIDRICVRAGLLPDDRAYLPHLTLARMSRSAGSAENFMASHAALSSVPFAMTEFDLYESHLGQSGAAYHLIERYPANYR